MMLTTNFHLDEFACKDGTPVPNHLIVNVTTLAKNLQVLRDYLGEPIHINSGYRTPEYNKRVGGKPASKHLIAQAADITVKSKSPRQLKKIIEQLIAAGKMKNGGIGLYPGFYHIYIQFFSNHKVIIPHPVCVLWGSACGCSLGIVNV